jgi:KUP system potassium uptake protein
LNSIDDFSGKGQSLFIASENLNAYRPLFGKDVKLLPALNSVTNEPFSRNKLSVHKVGTEFLAYSAEGRIAYILHRSEEKRLVRKLHGANVYHNAKVKSWEPAYYLCAPCFFLRAILLPVGKHLHKVSSAGLLIALGIVFGDIGTSPLYVFNAICNGKVISEDLILGALSCIIWTLTLQTTLKYVVLTLRADNRGEGGIFSLFALVRRHRRWVVFPAMIGGACILADGMITPPISVISALEGLKNIESISHYMSESVVVSIGLGIITLLFLSQQFGTATIGKAFGPIMTAWFGMLGTLGIMHLSDDWTILRAFNPVHAIDFVVNYPGGFWLLGAVFLCTTGAEALYSDMGHAGRGNIRMSWIFVKATIILNYLGQGAWLLHTRTGATWSSEGSNPFYALMSPEFLPFGVALATAGAIIASQAMITGSFTLISEAIKLNLWPKMKIQYPTVERGQIFIPGINLLLYAGCVGITLYFRKSSNMDAAYGLAIVSTFIITS